MRGACFYVRAHGVHNYLSCTQLTFNRFTQLLMFELVLYQLVQAN